MKYFILTVEDGKRLPVDVIEAKRKAVKDKVLGMGLQYIETEAMMGSLDALARRIESRVYIIEATTRDFYV